MKDYYGTPIAVGDSIRNIENAWHGRIESAYDEQGTPMLICKGINFWTGEIDHDDVQHHAAADVVKWTRQAGKRDPVNNLNLL